MSSFLALNENIRGASHLKRKRTSKNRYFGVNFNKTQNNWRVLIRFGGKQHHIGYYSDEVEAAKAYDNVAKELSNKQLNFPETYPEHTFIPGRVINAEVTSALQRFGSAVRTSTTSAYFGVSFNKQSHKWQARIKLGGVKQHHIGYYTSELEAAKAYDNVAKELSNKSLHFPEDYPTHVFIQGCFVQEEVEAALKVIDSGWCGGSSRLFGVSHYKPTSKWLARIRILNRLYHISYHNDEVEAGKAYDLVAKELPSLKLNFPLEYPDHVHVEGLEADCEADVDAAINVLETELHCPNNGTEEYHGISFVHNKVMFSAQVYFAKTRYCLGLFETVKIAAEAYDSVACHLSNRKLNFPNEHPKHKFTKASDIAQEVVIAQQVIETEFSHNPGFSSTSATNERQPKTHKKKQKTKSTVSDATTITESMKVPQPPATEV